MVVKVETPCLQRPHRLLFPGGACLATSGPHITEVAREAMGLQHGVVAALGQDNSKLMQNLLVWVREGDQGYVRSIKMAEMGRAINVERPHFVEVESWIVSGNKSHNPNSQVAVVRIPIAPVKKKEAAIPAKSLRFKGRARLQILFWSTRPVPLFLARPTCVRTRWRLFLKNRNRRVGGGASKLDEF